MTDSLEDIDPEKVEEIREWFNEPLDLGFPDGYRVGEL